MTDNEIPKWERVKARPWDLLNKNIEHVEKDVAEFRLNICKACPEYIKTTHQCKKCGCIMNLKVKLPHASCPLNKWEAVEVGFEEII
jgi:hypothetical protein